MRAEKKPSITIVYANRAVIGKQSTNFNTEKSVGSQRIIIVGTLMKGTEPRTLATLRKFAGLLKQ